MWIINYEAEAAWVARAKLRGAFHNIHAIKECDIRTFYRAIFNYDSCSYNITIQD